MAYTDAQYFLFFMPDTLRSDAQKGNRIGLLWSVLVLYGARLLAESVPMKITKAKEKFLLVNTLVSKKLVVLK